MTQVKETHLEKIVQKKLNSMFSSFDISGSQHVYYDNHKTFEITEQILYLSIKNCLLAQQNNDDNFHCLNSIITLPGPRQSGKTTAVVNFAKESNLKTLMITAVTDNFINKYKLYHSELIDVKSPASIPYGIDGLTFNLIIVDQFNLLSFDYQTKIMKFFEHQFALDNSSLLISII